MFDYLKEKRRNISKKRQEEIFNLVDSLKSMVDRLKHGHKHNAHTGAITDCEQCGERHHIYYCPDFDKYIDTILYGKKLARKKEKETEEFWENFRDKVDLQRYVPTYKTMEKIKYER